MKVQQAYQEWAATYDSDRNLTRDLDAQVTRAALENLCVHSALELGCGTGKNTALLARISGKVLAIDFSPAMIAKAREKATYENVTFTLADLSRPWPCDELSVDLISCNLVLEHIDDLSFVFAEAARVLSSEGRFFISELHPYLQYRGVQARFERGDETTTIEAFVHDITDFTGAAGHNRLSLGSIKEWRHEEDKDKPPRLISFLFTKP
jgi:ubiquinone/menaquinone biosynthesis C-methylase UbiE